jgi:beta-galactosidase/beta-glucuronidase
MRNHALILTLAVLIGTPALAGDWKPAGDRIKTRWAADVTPDNAWQEYPRPQMVRNNWQNLNGLWNYAVVAAQEHQDQTAPTDWEGKILVPFCLESSLSGVGRLLEPGQQLWYRRDFEIDKQDDQRTILHFEAVDYECQVWVNGKSVGTHKGGNTPFRFDVTEASVDGKNELTVTAIDPTGNHQLRGKQVLGPRGIWYIRVSGIWQTVWLEQVPATYIERIKIDTEIAPASIKVATTAAGDAARATTVRITASFDGKQVAEATGKLDQTTVTIADAKLWSPSDPNLYDLTVELLADGKVVDSIDSYAGIRKVGRRRDAKGHWRFTLNDQEIFHLGPLDQGWWPDGLLTPPSDEAMRFDIQYLKDAGFNMIRSHIKVRPRRYYYHCDKLGMMMWQDQVSGMPGPGWTRMRPNPKAGEWPEAAHQQYMYELRQMIDSLYNSPCIVMWVPFNESWGQHQTMKIGKWVSAYDPTRHNNIASGGNFWPVGDVADHHSYPHPAFPSGDPRFADYIQVVGEFGGHGFVADTKHLWNPGAKNWGYGGLPKNKEELLQRYKTSIEILRQLRDAGVAGGVYTQTTDVENEVNGLITYDREIIKFPAADLAKIHAALTLGR